MQTSFYLALIGFVLMVILTIINKVDTGFVYFFDLSRMGSFMVGSFLASFVKRFSFKKISYNNPTLVGIGLIFLMALTMSYDSKVTYIIGFLLTDLITGFLILVGFSNPQLYENKFVSRLAEYSYGFYIFHWPVWVLVSNYDKTSKGLIIAIIVTILLVLFNHHVFEPIFKGKNLTPLLNKDKKYEINYKKYGILFQTSIIFMVITGLSLSYAISDNAGAMMSLERQILKESVNQDIEKIKLDKNDLDKFLGKENDKVKEETSLTLIGDSVMLGPRQYLSDNISNLYINAEGSRPLEDGANIIAEMENTGNLGDLVILALGTNAEKSPMPSLKKIINDFPEGKRLILVTCYDNRYPQPHPVSVAMKEIAKKYDFVTLMEWEDYAIKNPNFYEGTDGVHFYGQTKAYEAYLRLLNEAIDKSLLNTAKGD
ncbi:acyltransferase family protein [Anaerococcus cruorum]|uniref:acyltransferase family protein n=1 Tax=Anaerococcus sp. WGS1596 TaxID=3366806 RepID=UPI00372D5A22